MALLTREQDKPRPGALWEVYGSIACSAGIAMESLADEVLENRTEPDDSSLPITPACARSRSLAPPRPAAGDGLRLRDAQAARPGARRATTWRSCCPTSTWRRSRRARTVKVSNGPTPTRSLAPSRTRRSTRRSARSRSARPCRWSSGATINSTDPHPGVGGRLLEAVAEDG